MEQLPSYISKYTSIEYEGNDIENIFDKLFSICQSYEFNICIADKNKYIINGTIYKDDKYCKFKITVYKTIIENKYVIEFQRMYGCRLIFNLFYKFCKNTINNIEDESKIYFQHFINDELKINEQEFDNILTNFIDTENIENKIQGMQIFSKFSKYEINHLYLSNNIKKLCLNNMNIDYYISLFFCINNISKTINFVNEDLMRFLFSIINKIEDNDYINKLFMDIIINNSDNKNSNIKEYIKNMIE